MITNIFTRVVDELVYLSENDPELANAIKWVDKQSNKKGITFYEMVFEILHKHDIKIKANQWLNSRN